MSRPTINDLPALSANAQATADRLHRDGRVAWDRIRSWQTGTRSPSLDPNTRGWKHDSEGEPIPNDPTGEAGTQPDDLRHIHDHFADLLARYNQLGNELDRLLRDAVPKPVTVSPTDDVDLAADGWCVSCHTDAGFCEPITEDRGVRVFATVCRWCGTFKRTEGVAPPVSLLRARHEGRKITSSMVERALGRVKVSTS